MRKELKLAEWGKSDFKFLVAGHPIGMQRHQDKDPRKTRGKKKKFVPQKTREYQDKIQKAFREKYCGNFLDEDHEWYLEIMVFYTSKRIPDQSNILKNIEDALQGILWANDKQIRTGKYDRVQVSNTEAVGVRIKKLGAWK